METAIPASIYQNGKGIHLVINAKPNSKQTFVQYVEEQNIGLCIKAPAHDNEANRELQRYLAEILAIKPKEIELEQGSKCPSKIVCLPAHKLTIQQVYKCLRENSKN